MNVGGLFGHQAKECPRSGNPVCYNCGNDGHFSKDCQEPERAKSCYNCGSADHLLRECPEEARKPQMVTETSSNSGAARTVEEGAETPASSEQSEEVASEDSKVPSGPKNQRPALACYKCGKVGHKEKNCRGRGFAKKTQCYSCGGFGHLSKDCRHGQKCYKCGEMGHLSKDCEHTGGDKVCYECKEAGHIASQCPTVAAS